MSRNQAIPLKATANLLLSPLHLAAQSFMLSREAMDCTSSAIVWYRKYIQVPIFPLL